MKQKILITGLSSSLMRSFADLIDKSKFEVIGLSRKSMPKSSGFAWITGSISELSEMKEKLSGIQVLIHAAAVTHAFNEKDYFDINFIDSNKLIDSAIDSGVERIVYISSRAAGEKAGGYGKSKILAEAFIKEKCPNWLILRPAEIFGGSKNEGIEKLINDVLTKKILFYPAGGEKMYPIDLIDTSKLMYKYTFLESKKNETLTINGKDGFKYKDLIKLISKKANRSIIAFPIPKFIMFGIKSLLRLTNLKIGLVPDQIDRFYAEKRQQKTSETLKPLSIYIEEVLIKKNLNNQ